MHAGALAPYEDSLVTRTSLHLRSADGRTVPLDIARWLGPADDVDRAAITRMASPVLDVGCGPGRLVAALSEQGRMALGIDISATAVAMTRLLGVNALRRSVFEPLPGERRWRCVALLDGNVGIGGDVAALLGRARSLLAPDGRIVLELDPDDATDDTGVVRFVHGGRPIGPEFGWASVGIEAVRRVAGRSGLAVVERWTSGGRCFATLQPILETP
jgi:SAM-dependent methyltransferase